MPSKLKVRLGRWIPFVGIALAISAPNSLAVPTYADAPRQTDRKPTGGKLLDPANAADVSGLKLSNATVTMVPENGAPALEMESAAATGYPGFDVPAPACGWDLSDYGGVTVDVTNVGQTDATVGMRVDNVGDWTTSPFNTELVKLPPGMSKTITVAFGVSYHAAGFALDSAHVVRIKLFLVSPKPPTALAIKNLMAVPKTAIKALPADRPDRSQ